ncbi:MAG: sugar transferase [bacterium]|nr:sugar transferase [bacterium]
MKNNASLLYGFFLVIGDFLALIAAFVGAYILRVKFDTRPIYEQGLSGWDFVEAFIYLLPFWVIIFGVLGLYNKNVYENRFSEFGRLLVGSFVGILFVIGYAYFSETQIFPTRLITFYSFLLAFFIVLLFRTIARGIRRSLFHFGIGINNVLIVGDTTMTGRFIESIADTKATGYKIIGIVGPKKHKDYQHFPSFADAVKALARKGVHSIIQTELYADPIKNTEIMAYAQENHIAFRFVPGNSELFVGNIDVDLFHSIPVIAVHQTALVGWGRIVKRLFDLGFGGLMLLLSLPIMVLVGLLILIFDTGPIFYRQERLSRFNEKVKIFKFRTMKRKYSGPLPEEAFDQMGRPGLIKQYRDNGDFLEDDPRVSRIGKILRTTSLDELPQLFNVVKGDISLVGPRALVERDLTKYDKKNLILSVKSGMTGLAVISGRKDLPFDERRKLDLYYVQNWSFWNDVVILTKTIAIVLFRSGAK